MRTPPPLIRRALDVPNIAFELEARGMALTDYANTLSRLHRNDEAAHDKQIRATFEEALAVFRTERRILGGTLARNSYAVYLNERLLGSRSENQERALALAQEAIDLIESEDQSEWDQNNDFLRRTLSGPYLTKSNVILQREDRRRLGRSQGRNRRSSQCLGQIGQSER